MGGLSSYMMTSAMLPFIRMSMDDGFNEKKFKGPQPIEPLKPCKICGVETVKVCCSGDHYREWKKRIKSK